MTHILSRTSRIKGIPVSSSFLFLVCPIFLGTSQQVISAHLIFFLSRFSFWCVQYLKGPVNRPFYPSNFQINHWKNECWNSTKVYFRFCGLCKSKVIVDFADLYSLWHQPITESYLRLGSFHLSYIYKYIVFIQYLNTGFGRLLNAKTFKDFRQILFIGFS